MSNKIEDLEKLAKLKEQGILSDEEFIIEKKKILKNDLFTGGKGINRLWFNLIFFILIIPLFIIGGGIYIFEDSIYGLAIIILILTSIPRFKNIGMSGWYSLGLLVPLWGWYLLFLLIFKE